MSPVPSWQPFLAGERLWLTKIALLVDQGHVDEALHALQVAAAFTRRLLAQPNLLLIDKMILATSYRRSLQFTSDLVRAVGLNDAQYRQLAAAVTPLRDDERSLAGADAREFVRFASMVSSLQNPPHAAGTGSGAALGRLENEFETRVVFKPNATLNLAWSFVEKNQAASRGPCALLSANEAALERSTHIPLLRYIYNPVGKILGRLSASTTGEYNRAMCDLQGMQNIVALQIALKAAHVAEPGIADYVRVAAPRYGNPYTDGPLEWNAADKSLSFQPVADRSKPFLPWPI